MNKLFIIGNLVRDPELRTTQSGIAVCAFTVAVNRREQGAEAGRPEADFFKVTAWRALGETAAKYLSKGRKVAVVGTVGVSAYTAQNGECRASLEVTASQIEFLGGQTQQQTDTKAGFVPVVDEELPF